jgi:hypothetical protein
MIRDLVLRAVNRSNIPFKYIKDLHNKFPPFFNHIWMLMAIHIHPLFCLLALIPKLESELSLGSRFCNHGINFKCREDYCINVLTEYSRGYSAKCLRCEIRVDIVQY